MVDKIARPETLHECSCKSIEIERRPDAIRKLARIVQNLCNRHGLALDAEDCETLIELAGK